MKRPVIIFIHVIYWILYSLLLLMLYGMSRINQPHGPPGYGLLVILAESATLPAIIVFYCCNTVLFTLFLIRRKIFTFIFLGLCISLFTAVPTEIILYFQIKGAIWNFENCLGIGLFVAINATLNGAMGAIFRAFVEWYKDIKVKEDLAKKNYETELALVKSQINPHFLFNTLNNIDVLIIKDPVTASAYLNKLSDIMRFMLYETKTEKIPLSKEMDYIEKYIELQRIRGSNPAYINFTAAGNTTDRWIAPMLFIPFIENALKHTENKNMDKSVSIVFRISHDKISFECRNHANKKPGSSSGYSGLGKELIQKRLALLYSGKHTLQIEEPEDLYIVKLELEI